MRQQLPLFGGWVDGRQIEPPDGQQIVSYTWIKNPGPTDGLGGDLLEYDGMLLSGPIVRRYEKRFVEQGMHRPVAFWQPIEPLPEVTHGH